MTLRLLAVHAHPDDESSKGAGTYAAYVDRGVDVMVVSCTGGERGDILNESVAHTAGAKRDIAGFRRHEMAAARDILGIQHRWLGYVDSGFQEGGDSVPPLSFADIPMDISAEALVRVVREFRPHVMITYNEIGGYPHPDHIRCHEISMRAWHTAGDPAAYPDAGDPWDVSKLYFDEIFNAKRMTHLRDAIRQRDPHSPILEQAEVMAQMLADRGYTATTRIDITGYFERRDEALRAHRSQVPPESLLFFLPNDVQREAWPFEDYRLAASRVPVPPTLPEPGDRGDDMTYETDLFAGITGEMEPTGSGPMAPATSATAPFERTSRS